MMIKEAIKGNSDTVNERVMRQNSRAMKGLSPKKLWQMLKRSFSGFNDDKILKLSASLAYYTLFSLGPLLFMVIMLAGMFYGKAAVEGRIYGQLAAFVGHDTAIQLQYIIRNAAFMGKGILAIVIGGLVLLIGATSVFAEIQDSLNMIWGVKSKPKSGLVSYLQNRFLSFSIIIGMGFLLLVSLAVSAIFDNLTGWMQTSIPSISLLLIHIAGIVLSYCFITIIFGAIFKVLPDVRIKWRDVIAGSLFTAFLFMIKNRQTGLRIRLNISGGKW
jgi:membrane protein